MSTDRRQRPRINAALNPAGPAPTIITSYVSCMGPRGWRSVVGVTGNAIEVQ
jgi:hypothetical protein